MLGQGSPVLSLLGKDALHLRAVNRSATTIGLAFLLWVQFAFFSIVAAQTTSDQPRAYSNVPSHLVVAPLYPTLEVSKRQLGVRVSWGGGDEVQWQGSIQCSSGPISRIRALGLTDDTPGSIYLKEGTLRIAQPSKTSYGGVEFFVDDAPDATLYTAFQNPEQPDQIIRQTIPISDLLQGTVSKELGQNENRLTLARSPGDHLQLEFSRDHLVFETGESFEVSVRPNRLPLVNQRVKCRATLLTAREHYRTDWSVDLEFEVDEQGNAVAQTIDLPIPAEEGVYDLKLTVEPKNFTQRLAYNRPLTRSLQLVALHPHAPASNRVPWQEQALIDPTHHRSSPAVQWSQLLRATGLQSGTLHSKRTIVQHESESWVELEPGGWQAIQLKVDPNGQPVKLEIEYAGVENSAIGLSILQPGSDGAIPTYGFDSGVVVPESFSVDRSPQSTRGRHQIIFWPQSKQPFLLIANQSETTSIRFGKIRVHTGPDRLDSVRLRRATAPIANARQFMAFYESPMFPENFGADEVNEPAIQQTLDDWVTFYQGADRLIQYLKSHGYSGAFLTVAVDSGAIYPSQHLGATPIFDSGVFFGSGQDPVQKDVLELLFRMFEREGLTLVPALALTGPIPKLESLDRQSPDSHIRPIDFQGSVLDGTDAQPVYNPLNGDVQEAVENIVGELSERYNRFQAFGGVSLLCRPDTYTQLGGRRWGYDSPTVTQFLNDTGGIQLASGINNNWTQIQNLLLGSNQDQWIVWRAHQMAQWYQRIHSRLSSRRSDRRLYLSAVDIYRHPDIVSSLSPSLHWSSQFEKAMLDLGWDSNALGQNPDILLLKPHRVDESSTIAASKVESQTEQSQNVKEFYQKQSIPGELFVHRARWAQFQELQGPTLSSFRPEPILRLQQLTPSSSQNRKRFIGSLRNLDTRVLVDGGWLLTMGQEDSLGDLIEVYTQLPDQAFDQVISSQPEMNRGPVAVRQVQVDGRWYFYCLNDSPWKTQASLTIQGKPAAIHSLGKSNLQPALNQPLQIQMEPYSIVAGFCDSTQTQIVDFSHTVDPEAARLLKARLNQLQLRLIQATDVQPMTVLENAEFQLGSDAVPGWVFDPNRSDEIQIQPSGPNNSALFMSSQKGSNWIRSNPFEVPDTGRLSISVWMRSDKQEQPSLRISVESESNGFYRFGSIGKLAPNDPSNQVTQDWRQFVVHFDDLPLAEGSKVQIGFDMMESGEVWIDRVQLYDRLFDAHDIRALTQRLAAARPLINSPTDYDLCRRMLNGYWLRFLNDYIGQDEPAQATVRNQGELLIEQEPAARTSSIIERFRNILKPRIHRR